MHELVLHPDCVAGPIKRVSAAIQPTPDGCRAKFRLDGDIGQIKVPVHAASERMDNLWKTTCFEIFWQPHGGSSYREFNLSPSSRWAAYDFDGFRENSRDAPVPAIAIACAAHDAKLELEAGIASALPLPADVALNAIVEDVDGNIEFWALAFADGKPEFHSDICRALTLEPL
ncbi:hypothetical protein [Erythrobacter litoralis]|uniref:DOMON-like domain-containing protein n=1 Tax=Erythrobacter litoralis (strain HTCC2594) TaxID=314225 RepID=Q2NAL5_ERYLH|nr:hypothetical protein [Erythrobacter litoralis]ABC63276.1 hypothetical protein ELI_05920 [Erythrobacter litoralis HTCC2594]